MSFSWNPGQGPDADALARMECHFPRPATVMSEAWFMAEVRKMYPSFLEREVTEHSIEELQTFLTEIASGQTTMGDVDSWPEWYGYLLPRCIPLSFERQSKYFGDYLLEYLVTAFMSVMPNSSDVWGYPTFKNDALLTLGRAIMAPELWPRGSLKSVGCLHPSKTRSSGHPRWARTSGDFASSMFFCLKYLDANDVQEWIESVFAIACPRWRAQVLVWLYGVHSFLNGTISQPVELGYEHVGQVYWAWSHIIDGHNIAYDEFGHFSKPIEFLPRENCVRCEETIQKMLNEELLFDWLESLSGHEDLLDDLTSTEIPERLRESYEF